MKLTIKTAVVGAVLASAAVLAAPGTASAGPKDPLPSNCREGMICFYDGHDLTGNYAEFYPDNTPYVGWGWNDRASSVWNHSGEELCIWTDADYNGRSYVIPAGATQELLFLYDNAVSSFSINQCGG